MLNLTAFKILKAYYGLSGMILTKDGGLYIPSMSEKSGEIVKERLEREMPGCLIFFTMTEDQAVIFSFSSKMGRNPF